MQRLGPLTPANVSLLANLRLMTADGGSITGPELLALLGGLTVAPSDLSNVSLLLDSYGNPLSDSYGSLLGTTQTTLPTTSLRYLVDSNGATLVDSNGARLVAS